MDINFESIVPVLNTCELVETLSQSFLNAINQKRISNHPAVFVQGSPGVGKSQSIYQIAKEIEMNTGKKVNVTDIRLLLFSPLDLRGIPTIDASKEKTIWLKPAIFDLEDSEDVINIVFLDELTAASPSIQAAAYQITLDKRIGEFEFPKNTFILASGNKDSDGAVFYDIPTPLKNRFMHFVIEPDLESWGVWANINHIHPDIIQFLKRNPQCFYETTISSNSNILVTPRSWELLSQVLYSDIKNHTIKRNLLSSIIGQSLTSLFMNDNQVNLIDDIYNGTIPNDLSIADINRTNDHILHDIKSITSSREKTNHILQYLTTIPPDYAMVVFKEIMKSTHNNFAFDELKHFEILVEQLKGLTTDAST
ncbi:AAA family ATPase [Paracholeplasma manati]|uniref:AAA family ATPase n=1 Tax=Paracholeplasma manati TaxID=591373 RepID=UPI00240889E1|nr:AAA family ATPase [Paracholeplasma manati]MDG0889648.1 AAA family ATPase [Paracholeplasma manati]